MYAIRIRPLFRKLLSFHLLAGEPTSTWTSPIVTSLQDKKGRYPLARKKQNTERSPEHGRKGEEENGTKKSQVPLATKSLFSFCNFCGLDEYWYFSRKKIGIGYIPCV